MWKLDISTWLLVLNLFAVTYAQSFSCNRTRQPSATGCVITDQTITSPTQDLTFVPTRLSYTPYHDPLEITHTYFYQNSIMYYIPTVIFEIFPNLIAFGGSNVSLTTFVPNNFGRCAQLQGLQFLYNPFTALPSGFALNCVNITSITMMYGSLQTIDVNSFEGLESLTTLWLSYNKITCLPPGLFSATPKLEYMLLDNNMITSLDPTVFNGLPGLYMIHLGNNSITTVPNIDFSSNNITQGVGFILSSNPITSIDPAFWTSIYPSQAVTMTFYKAPPGNCIPTNKTIQAINKDNYFMFQSSYSSCFDNWVGNAPVPCAPLTTTTTTTTTTTVSTTLPTTSTVSTCAADKVCRYYLDYMNKYTCVIDGVDSILTSISGNHIAPLFTDLSVTRVYFTNSILSRVPSILFSKFPNLEFLSIANCSLGIINDFTFSQCGSLKYLDASYNNIFHIFETSMKYCTSLQTIDLTGNPVDYISTEIYKYDPALQRVILNKV